MPDEKCKSDELTEAETTTTSTLSSSALETPFVKNFREIGGEEELPSIENDFTRAKAYLLKQSHQNGDNLWDHLNEVLKKILSERPKNIADTFEEFSLRVRETRFRDKTDRLRDIHVPSEHYGLSRKLIQLLQADVGYAEEAKDEEEMKQSDLMELLFYFEQTGVGLPRQELFCLGLHLKKLTINYPVEKYRFWGKILGFYKNYYVAETELNEEEVSRRNVEREEEEEKLKNERLEKEILEKEEEEQRRERQLEAEREKELEFAREREEFAYQELLKEAARRGASEAVPEKPAPQKPWLPFPPLPVSVVKRREDCPPEPTGIGANRKTYFVCSGAGDDWMELPDVKPEEIVAARKIKRFFTGHLDSPVVTYPAFPGNEKHYLRAQIARISSGTQISPIGFYTFSEEEGEPEEEGGGRSNCMQNADFEAVALQDLLDPSMSFWVHHSQYILKQGRTTWWNPSRMQEGEEEEEEKMGGENENSEREIGPELLTPLSEDASLDGTIPWSVRSSSKLFPENCVALVRSNLWPGAFAFAINKKFENIYIGFGQKFTAHNHTPAAMSKICEEYPLGPEIMEIPDPSPGEEEEWRFAHNRQSESGEEEEEEEEGADEDE